MAFIIDIFHRLRRPFFYVALLFNLAIAWPIYALILFLAQLQEESFSVIKSWQFFLSGYMDNWLLTVSVSAGTMFFYTLLYSWLRFKKDTVLERLYLRGGLLGAFLALINLFPTFFIYSYALGERNFEALLLYSFLGPLLSFVLTGPPALLSGALLGLINAVLAHIASAREQRKKKLNA